MLRAMGVGVMVVPCISSLLSMWSHKLGFDMATAAERRTLQDQMLLMDPDTSFLMKKALHLYSSLQLKASPKRNNRF